MKTNSMITKNQKVSDALADDVAAFLAKGGEITQMEKCSVEESNHKCRKPYKKRRKDGSVYFVRVSNQHISTNRVGPRVLRGHSTK